MFCLGDDLAPEVLREGGRGAAEYTNEVIFPGLDGFLCKVATVIVWGYKLESHVGGLDFVSVERRYFVVEDLMIWLDALVFHPCEGVAL